MIEPFRLLMTLLTVGCTAGFFMAWDRVCHALRIACAAFVVLLAGVFYGSSVVATVGALGVALGTIVALIRTGLLRQRPQPGVRHETLH